jgi:hypothetical protein
MLQQLGTSRVKLLHLSFSTIDSLKTIQALDLITLHMMAFAYFLLVLCATILPYVPHQFF